MVNIDVKPSASRRSKREFQVAMSALPVRLALFSNPSTVGRECFSLLQVASTVHENGWGTLLPKLIHCCC